MANKKRQILKDSSRVIYAFLLISILSFLTTNQIAEGYLVSLRIIMYSLISGIASSILIVIISYLTITTRKTIILHSIIFAFCYFSLVILIDWPQFKVELSRYPIGLKNISFVTSITFLIGLLSVFGIAIGRKRNLTY